MKKYFCCLMLLFVLFQSCKTTNYLRNSKSTLLNLQSEKFVKLSFNEQVKMLGHNFEPWETTNYTGKGVIWMNNNNFLKQDTLVNRRGKAYTSKTDYNNEELLFIDYGDTELLPITEELYFEKIMNTARYSPTIILDYFIKTQADHNFKTTSSHAIYNTKIENHTTQLFINLATSLIDKITYLSYHELYGDVTTTFTYSSYITSDDLSYPTSIQIDKINGQVVEIVTVQTMEIVPNVKRLIEKTSDYQLVESDKENTPEIKLTRYNNYIHFIDLIHTDDKVMVVEFDDYIFVAEAPINSKNGELIISEVKKIAPNKPIKYFAFGHHHPHYLGGVRAFVHKEATVICTDVSKNYVEYIVNAPHHLQPDSLHLNPKKLKTQVITDSLILGKDKRMKIYSIGDKSAHTKDYLLYYFPKDKLLFQDDLCWIPKEGAVRKAGRRQKGLYHAIKELNLDVETIIQSWPVTSHKVKTIIPFSDLEQSILIQE